MHENQLKTAIKAALRAGEEILKIYDSHFEVELKSDQSPLTEADKNANQAINSILTQTKLPIISEENKQIDYTTRKKWERCWIVDPLDGTKEFVKRNGEFTVNIALVENEKPILGVIYVPVTQTLYFADVGSKKAYKIEHVDYKTTADYIFKNAKSIGPKTNHSQLVRIVGSRSHMSQETLDHIKVFKNRGKIIEMISKGSSLKFCLIAEGLADMYPRFAPTMEWDTAAGQAICSAVGVEVISQDTNKPLLYNKQNLLNPYFIVSSNDDC